MAGKTKEAAAILEALLAPPADTSTGSAPPTLAPTLALAARYDLAVAYRALGRSADADALLVKLASESAGPVTADAQFLLGQAHLDAGRYAAAIPALEQYVAANPQGDVADFALAHLAMARLGLGQLDGAWKNLASLAPTRFPRSKALDIRRGSRLAEAALATPSRPAVPPSSSGWLRLPREWSGKLRQTVRGETGVRRDRTVAASASPGRPGKSLVGAW